MNKIKCPICNSINSENVYTNRHAFFANADIGLKLEIKRCVACDFVFQSSAYKQSYNKTTKGIYQNFRKSAFFTFPNRTAENSEAVEIILAHAPKKRGVNILEIGSNRGDLLYMIKEKIQDANILGVEPTHFESTAVPTIKSFFKKELFSSKFDIVILQHVLEHIKYPKQILSEVSQIISEEGIVYIEIPYLNNSLKYGLDDFSPEHVSYFNLNSLSRALGHLAITQHNTVPFLKIIAKNNNLSSKVDFNDARGLKAKFKDFKKKKHDMLKEIMKELKAGKNLVFYGVSYYFRSLFKEMLPGINLKACYYYDDNYRKPFDELFGLPRLKNFDDRCVVIICSTNFLVQEAIEKKLFAYVGIKVIRPWFRINTN